MTRWETKLAEIGDDSVPVQLGLPLGGESEMALWLRAREAGWDPSPFHGPGVELLGGWKASAQAHLDVRAGEAADQAMRGWFVRNASHWDEVDDVDAEIRLWRGRDDDDDEDDEP